MHFVYFLRSESRPSKTYVGMTEDVETRLALHNSGGVPSTSRFRPWSLISYVAVQTPAQAADLERYFKTGSGHAFWHKRFADSSKHPAYRSQHLTDQPSAHKHLEALGMTREEAIIVCMCYYQIPLAGAEFAAHACREWDLPKEDIEAILKAMDFCVTKGWIRAVPAEAVVPETDENNNPNGESLSYPSGGFVLTEAGWSLWKQIPQYLR